VSLEIPLGAERPQIEQVIVATGRQFEHIDPSGCSDADRTVPSAAATGLLVGGSVIRQ
jgi:hypothetical protein